MCDIGSFHQWYVWRRKFWPVVCVTSEILTSSMRDVGSFDQWYVWLRKFSPVVCVTLEVLTSGMCDVGSFDQWCVWRRKFWPVVFVCDVGSFNCSRKTSLNLQCLLISQTATLDGWIQKLTVLWLVPSKTHTIQNTSTSVCQWSYIVWYQCDVTIGMHKKHSYTTCNTG